MDLTFDPVKDAANIAKHGVSLTVAADFEWEGAVVAEDDRRAYGEQRFAAIGYIGQRLYVVVYTDRRNGRRIISVRKANQREVKRYAET